MRPTDLIEVEYIIPRSESGDNKCKNKQLLHKHCYESKAALDNNSYPKLKLQDLPDDYLWMDDTRTGMFP
ncbi:MAG: HNH endonuclease [Trichodesmium sp. St16_bin2-tuft]|nr:HNH endonuclease [Trichodesmium sp. MAG_R02]MDE5076117.1 HNH endonuclease [Trichodesmium sp. St5_bin2_1]MDE5085977.1 HNH endonuclease [Trichodesmium sp. St16_bin2-tuft]MDE5112225.1 HNH endonuclease [Trichodesmium sp. St7_bin2_1]MDE5117468.1 HNH endonuclease [Trichodesmium sp. St2_bin2_1]MDE5124542.1 HNH endonuclease [Trichodesmium sp. St19_bin1]